MVTLSSTSRQKRVNGILIQVGMPLVDKLGNYLGRVKEIQHDGFLVDRSTMHDGDLFISFDQCMQDGADQLKLDVSQSELI